MGMQVNPPFPHRLGCTDENNQIEWQMAHSTSLVLVGIDSVKNFQQSVSNKKKGEGCSAFFGRLL